MNLEAVLLWVFQGRPGAISVPARRKRYALVIAIVPPCRDAHHQKQTLYPRLLAAGRNNLSIRHKFCFEKRRAPEVELLTFWKKLEESSGKFRSSWPAVSRRLKWLRTMMVAVRERILEVSTKAGPDAGRSPYTVLESLARQKGLALSAVQRSKTATALEEMKAVPAR
jgi:hypothetical protein